MMIGRQARWWIGLLAAAPLVLSGCGTGDDSAEDSSPEPGPTATATADGREAMASCLDDAGVETLTTGELPVLEGAEGIGLLLAGPRNLEPGPVSAAVFVFDSEEDAQAAIDGLAEMGFAADANAVGNVAVMWGAGADPETLDAISACVP